MARGEVGGTAEQRASPSDGLRLAPWARMLTAAWIAAGTVAVLLALLWLFQRRLIYFPLLQDVPPLAATTLPRAEAVTFETADGLRLSGWFVPPVSATSRATVIVFNGNAGDRSFRAPLAAALAETGLSVLLFDYRGYGRNPGSPSEQGLLTDARAARAYVAARADVDPARLIYSGESLGATSTATYWSSPAIVTASSRRNRAIGCTRQFRGPKAIRADCWRRSTTWSCWPAVG